MKSDRDAQGPLALATVAAKVTISASTAKRIYRNMAPSFREPRTTIGEPRMIQWLPSAASMVALFVKW